MKYLRMALLAGLIVIFQLVIAQSAIAARTLGWPNLIPQFKPLVAPHAHLSEELRYDFDEIMIVRDLSEAERKQPHMAEYVKSARSYEAKFKAKGIDVEKLVAAYRVYKKKMVARQSQVVQGLNGQTVRIAGYLLPLDYSEKAVRTFLLVPYIGACVHVPPPPPNQIVYVSLKKPFRPQQLFTPVTVRGLLSTKLQAHDVALGDGTAKITMGYSMRSVEIEPFRQN